MEIKGTAVKSIFQYMETKYPDYFKDWYSALPVESKEIFDNPVLATKWYDMEFGALIPMKLAAKLLRFEEQKMAWDMGVFSSVEALKGIYKVFIRVASTNFIISRAGSIIATYYKNTEVKTLDHTENKVTLELTKFNKNVNLIMYRIGGWIENTFYAVGCKNVKVEVRNVEDTYEFKTFIFVSWD